MTFLGMNVDDGRTHADRLRTGRERLVAAIEPLAAAIRSSEPHWRGVDGDSFRAAWDSRVALQAQEAIDALERHASSLMMEAEQQDEASSPESDGSTSGTTDNGGTADIPWNQGDAGDNPRDRDFNAERGAVPPEVAAGWQRMTDDERRRVAQAIVDEEFRKYGMDPKEIRFRDIRGNGTWNESKGQITINEKRLEDPDILHTLVHEVRHAAQHRAIRETRWSLFDWDTSDDYARAEEKYGASEEEIRAWRENQRWGALSYKSPPKAPDQGASQEELDEYYREYAEYIDQPVEKDARRTGREFTNSMTMEDLEAHQRAAGVR